MNNMKDCLRCGKQLSNKGNLNRHLRNIRICQSIYLDISPDEIIKNYNKYEEQYRKLINEKFDIDDNNKYNIKNNNKEIVKEEYICEYCNKIFTHRRSCLRHSKNYCKVKKSIDKNKALMDEFLSTKYNLLKIEYEEKLEKSKDEFQKENNKMKEKLEKKIKELETKMIPYTQNNSNTNNINNGHIGDNVTIINNFGEEKFTINAEECEKIMSSEFDMIIKLIEYIHVLPPENRNSFIPSLKEKYAMILRNQKWDLVDRTEFINNLVINKNVMLEELLDKFGSKFKNVDPSRSRSVINYCKNDEEEYKRIKTGATLLLFNHKELIKDTYETKYNKKIQAR